MPGLYAAGNVTDPSQQVLQAAANGSRVGAMISFSLADEDLQAAARPSANEADWDRRYSGEQIWSGNPNGTLVNEIDGTDPGRALDVGAGEGGDACWLAAHGWRVTASDVSQRGLDRVAAAADSRGLLVETLRADANAPEAFEPGAFDLVSAQYASIPRTPDRRGVRNVLDAVAPGGTAARGRSRPRADAGAGRHRVSTADSSIPTHSCGSRTSRQPSPASSDWDIEVHEKRPRPAGAASASHHVDDVVLRARRHPA